MSTPQVIVRPPAPSGLEALASALSVAVRIEPELVRAVRLSVLPSLDVGYEADLWFSDFVAAREPGSIVLRDDARRRLQGTLRQMLHRADRGEPIWRLWQEISRVHAHISPALLLEERITWLAISEGEKSQHAIEAELRGALDALIREDRGGIADWFSGAIRRLPELVQQTKTAWLLQQATQPSGLAAFGDRSTSIDGLDLSDLADVVQLLPDARLRVHRHGSDLEIGALESARGAVAILVPDTSPRIVELFGTEAAEGHRTVTIGVGETVSLMVGPGPVHIRTARGDVYEIPDTGRSRSERTGVKDDFWDDLLGYIRAQMLVPVVGPDLTVVNVGNAEQTFTTLIGQRLAERSHLTVSPGLTTTDQAVAAFLQERGQDEVELRLYRVINDIIVELDPAPGNALRDLAAITDVRLFVSMTPDRLLAKAINEVRFQGRPVTRELTFSPNQTTSEQLLNAQAAAPTDTVVLNLFGQAASTRQYAIHEEDRLEWLYALLSDTPSLPDWLVDSLKGQPMLFIGCEIPDWMGRFLLRMFSNSRLSVERTQFFFVGSSTSYEPSLSNFFATYYRRQLVQQLEMEPTAFVAELRARWEQQSTPRPRAAAHSTNPDARSTFISYMREDAAAARRLHDAITSLGEPVWLDEQRLRPGDAWQPEILTAIRNTVGLFVPIISANTEREEEGYVFREWTAAAERARGISSRRFIVPVIVDEDYDGDPSRYRKIPEDFGRLQFGRAPRGDPDAALLAMLTKEIRAMRRTGEA
jgi:hypothetical protein